MPATDRSKPRSSGGSPTPAEIRRAREAAGLTQQEAGELIHTGWHTWQKWETEGDDANRRRMPPAAWDLFQIKLAARKALERGTITAVQLRQLGIRLKG